MLRSHFCDGCQAPTAHKQTEGLEDGVIFAVLRCGECGLLAEAVPGEEDDELDLFDRFDGSDND